MTAAMFISLAVSLLQSVLGASKAGGIAPEVIASVQAALAKLIETQGSPVTYSQLESLRVEPKW